MIIALQYCVVSTKHQHELAIGLPMSPPTWTPFPPPSPSHPFRLLPSPGFLWWYHPGCVWSQKRNIFNLTIQYFEKYSSTSYLTAAFTFASGHDGLEIKLLYYCILYSVYSKVPQRITTCRGYTHVTCELTCILGYVNTCLHLWKFTNRRFVCRGLTLPISFGSKARNIVGAQVRVAERIWFSQLSE